MASTWRTTGTVNPLLEKLQLDLKLSFRDIEPSPLSPYSGAYIGYLIEKGKVTRPVRGATLIGNGPDAMTKVSMVGDDLQLDAGVGVCGKEGQSVPVGVGQPTLRIDGLTVGGTAT